VGFGYGSGSHAEVPIPDGWLGARYSAYRVFPTGMVSTNRLTGGWSVPPATSRRDLIAQGRLRPMAGSATWGSEPDDNEGDRMEVMCQRMSMTW